MKSLAVLVWLILSSVAAAQTVSVKAGDHPGFTRLVLELPKAMDWRMGRTGEGYTLRLDAEGLRFDLSGVFTSIQRNRLAAIWRDPQSGDLQLGIGCACHALPFEFRPGIIVIDLRDGPPPAGSSFELALDGGAAEKLAARPNLRPRPRPGSAAAALPPSVARQPGYDWLAVDLPQGDAALSIDAVDASAAIAPVLPGYDTRRFKDVLLRQLSRGAAQGVVQMQRPDLSARGTAPPPPIGPRANVRLGDSAGYSVATARGAPDLLIGNGAECTNDAALAVQDWGDGQPVSAQIANARAGLIGEFDKPNPEAVIRAVKLYLFLGFGAEARQLLQELNVDDPDRPLWASMAKLVDGAADVAGPFTGMQSCDTAAALWSVLAVPELGPGMKPQTEAVLRGFSALPLHLRRTLGPGLAAKFLALQDVATARAIGNAIARGPDAAGSGVAVMQAEIDLAAGNPAAATNRLEPLIAEGGPKTAEALLALIDARLAEGAAVDNETTLALAALVREHAGAELEPALKRAQILALALSGEFDPAFDLLPDSPATETDLWQLLAKMGSDSALLTHAVIAPGSPTPKLDSGVKTLLADRLIALGLPDPALVWLGDVSAKSDEEDRLLIASAQLRRWQAEAALATIDGAGGAKAAALRAEAFRQLERPADAASAWSEAGNAEAAIRAQSWARDWAGLSQTGTGPWQAAAGLLVGKPAAEGAGPSGPLAQGAALVKGSAEVRAVLAALLQSVPGPTE